MGCDLIDLAKAMLKDFERGGLHTDSYFERMNYASLPLWSEGYCSAICTLGFMEDHINLTISYESRLDPVYPNPRRVFEYCNPTFPNNLYKFVDKRADKVIAIRNGEIERWERSRH